MATISGWSLVSDVDPEDGSGLPGTFELKQNYPNPFNPSTTIEYCLAERCHVSISVYNVLGERVTTLVDKAVSAGRYTAMWDGRDSRGRLVSSGLYFCRLRAADLTETRKMLLLR